jgi:Fe-S-cluster containining protein
MRLPVLYDCLKCPSYCCTYPRIAVTKRDIKRLARRFGIDAEVAERRFTKRGHTKREKVLRHQQDEHFGSACRFLDLETRLCTVHTSRPDVCPQNRPSEIGFISPACAFVARRSQAPEGLLPSRASARRG